MFDSIGWSEILVLLVAGLFILGPDRLPQAASWLGKAMRRARGYAAGARDQLHSELGTELDEIREPLSQLRSLRDLDPKRALRHHLLDDYDPADDLAVFDPRDELDELRRGQPSGEDGAASAGASHIRPGPAVDHEAT